MRQQLIVSAVILLCISACHKAELTDNVSTTATDMYTIEINTTRSIGNILSTERNPSPFTKASNDDDDFFNEVRQVQSFESIVLPELQPHIWVGNILTKESIADCNYKPLIYPRSPITVSLTLPQTSPKTIASPSFSNYLSYIQEQIENADFNQNDEFNYSIEQFTSYSELKTAFGSNVNTNQIFNNSSSTSSETDYQISKATGLYVKFYQTTFKAIMDYPNSPMAEIPEDKIESAVYINSITYGRLGILTLETNETVEYANTVMNNIFNKIFTSESVYYSSEETSFLDGCSFKVYLIGGNGATSVETFSGLSGFIQHIKRGVFSKEEPGAPIFCTFNHVQDNSPVGINFKYNIKREPLYVEMKYEDVDSENGNINLHFYRNKSKVPTIANPNIEFKVQVTHMEYTYPSHEPDTSSVRVLRTYMNSGYQTSIQIANNVKLSSTKIEREGSPREGFRTYYHVKNASFMLYESDKYRIMGINPINSRNAHDSN